MYATSTWSAIRRGPSWATAAAARIGRTRAATVRASLRHATGSPPRGLLRRVVEHPDDGRPLGAGRLEHEDVALAGVHPAHHAVGSRRGGTAGPREERDGREGGGG